MTIDYAALAERLEAHAECHANVELYDDEQRQWADDLRTVAAMLRGMADALADAERFTSFAFPPFCDEYAGVDLYDQASIYASAFGREEPNRDDYVAALRDAVDAALAQAKDAEARKPLPRSSSTAEKGG